MEFDALFFYFIHYILIVRTILYLIKQKGTQAS